MSTSGTNEVQTFLRQHQEKELLRLVVVGSVDDGKSTLIGRLLHDTQGVYDDQLSAVKRASNQSGMEIDFSLFTDGLKAEREQGITIDVAYRYCSTEQRKFIIADTPGHVQYTRNMATGASTANVGLILIDARLGVLQQSRRHAYIASLLGIPHLAVVVNKMDLRGYDRAIFEEITKDFRRFSQGLGFKDVTFIPASALAGDNIVERSAKTSWYDGPTVLSYLETVPISADRNVENFRYPVQFVLRPHLNYRGFAGEIISGTVRRGDEVLVLPSRKATTVASIDTYEGSIEEARCPLSVTLTLTDEVDVSRGDMLVHPGDEPVCESRFRANVVWMSEKPLDPHKTYLLKHTTQRVRVAVESVVGRTNLETLDQEPAETLELNDIGTLRLRCHRPLYLDPYSENRDTGAFILIDSLTNNTVGAGMVLATASPESVAQGEFGDHSQVSRTEREQAVGQRSAVVLLCGLPGSGKTRLAYAVERLLYDRGRMAMVVDPGDGHFRADGAEPGRLPASTLEVASRGAELGAVVLLSFACPDASAREAALQTLGDTRRLRVWVEADEEVRHDRAARFYAEAQSPRFDPIEGEHLRLTISGDRIEEAAQQVLAALDALR